MPTAEINFADIVTVFADGVRVTVRAKPGLSRSRLIKVIDIGDGKRAVEISVAATAQDGKANRALIERVADEWGVPQKAIAIKVGATGRLKIIEINGDGASLARLIAAKLQT